MRRLCCIFRFLGATENTTEFHRRFHGPKGGRHYMEPKYHPTLAATSFRDWALRLAILYVEFGKGGGAEG